MQAVLFEDREELIHALLRISRPDISDIANIPSKIAATKGDQTNVLEMIFGCGPFVILKRYSLLARSF